MDSEKYSRHTSENNLPIHYQCLFGKFQHIIVSEIILNVEGEMHQIINCLII